MERLDAMDVSYFIYTVHKNRNCIYHRGKLTEEEATVYQHMKRSPYRQYLDDDHFALEEIVYLKIVALEERAEAIRQAFESGLTRHGLRAALRPQAGLEGGFGLYFYAIQADVQRAEKKVVRLMRKQAPQLKSQEVFSKAGYHTEHDAIHLLHLLRNLYEPFRPFAWFTEKRKKRQVQM